MSTEEITKFLQLFKRRRDDMLNEDADTFDHHLERFIQFCRTNPLVRRVLDPLEGKVSVDANAWLEAVCEHDAKVTFPDDLDEELLLRYRVLERAAEDDHLRFRFGVAQGQRKQDGWINLFRILIVRPFVQDLSYRISSGRRRPSGRGRRSRSTTGRPTSTTTSGRRAVSARRAVPREGGRRRPTDDLRRSARGG